LLDEPLPLSAGLVALVRRDGEPARSRLDAAAGVEPAGRRWPDAGSAGRRSLSRAPPAAHPRRSVPLQAGAARRPHLVAARAAGSLAAAARARRPGAAELPARERLARRRSPVIRARAQTRP